MSCHFVNLQRANPWKLYTLNPNTQSLIHSSRAYFAIPWLKSLLWLMILRFRQLIPCAICIFFVLLILLNSSSPVFKPMLPFNPAFVPMTGVSKAVRDAIWGRTIRFAFEIDTYCDGLINDRRVRVLSRLYQTRISITQVCQDFRVLQCISSCLHSSWPSS